MSIVSTVFAAFMLLACFRCLFNKEHRGLGVAMLLSLVLYVQPVRELIPFGQEPIYLFLVDLLAATIVLVFSRNTIAGRVVLATISILIVVAHIPAVLPNIFTYGNVATTDVLANYAGWVQIAAMIGGTGGFKRWRLIIPRFNARSGLGFMGSEQNLSRHKNSNSTAPIMDKADR